MTETERKALVATMYDFSFRFSGMIFFGFKEGEMPAGIDRAARQLELDGQRLEALSAEIKQHEAFRQEVSDALEKQFMWLLDKDVPTALRPFLIAKPDPLADALKALEAYPTADELRAAIEKRGGKITWGEKP